MSSGVIDQTKGRFSLVTFLPVLKLLPSDKSERKSMLLDLDAAVRTLDLFKFSSVGADVVARSTFPHPCGVGVSCFLLTMPTTRSALDPEHQPSSQSTRDKKCKTHCPNPAETIPQLSGSPAPT